MLTNPKLLSVAAAFAAVLAAPQQGVAEDYPDRAVSLVLGVAPGGGSDTVARYLAKVLQEKWGKPVVVENRPGADGTIASALVAKAKPDGYTLLFTNNGFSLSPINMKVTYDPLNDFAPITQIGQTPLVLAANPSLGVSDAKRLVELVKSKPDAYSAGASGSANSTWNAMQQLMKATDMKMVAIPYKGAAAMVTALVAGEVQVGFSNVVGVFPHLEANGGSLKPLAVTSSARSGKLPDVPTLKEALGLDHFDIWNAWYGMLAPAGTPADIVAKLNKDVVDALRSEDLKKGLSAEGLDIIGSTPAEFKATLANHLKLYTEILKPAAK
jgi:tripartite-type tricarboxylate transporter receptor subunit TctC